LLIRSHLCDQMHDCRIPRSPARHIPEPTPPTPHGDRRRINRLHQNQISQTHQGDPTSFQWYRAHAQMPFSLRRWAHETASVRTYPPVGDVPSSITSGLLTTRGMLLDVVYIHLPRPCLREVFSTHRLSQP